MVCILTVQFDIACIQAVADSSRNSFTIIFVAITDNAANCNLVRTIGAISGIHLNIHAACAVADRSIAPCGDTAYIGFTAFTPCIYCSVHS